GALEIDRGLRPLEVVALRNLLLRLIDGVVDFLDVHAGRHVERNLAGHGSILDQLRPGAARASSQTHTTAIHNRFETTRCAICSASGASSSRLITPSAVCTRTKVTTSRRPLPAGRRPEDAATSSQTATRPASTGCQMRRRIRKCDVGSKSAATPSASEA